MDKKTSRNVRLGIFVLAGTAFLIFTLYMVGSKRNLFGNTFQINATFNTVNGLTKGNNVRFAGIDVGTVERIDIVNDTTVNVVMVIEEKVRQFIRITSVAAVGTDGLMGNKLINISPPLDNAPIVEEGDTLVTRQLIEGDEMMRTLEVSNRNLAYITEDIKKMMFTVNNTHGTIWALLNDTALAMELKKTVSSVQVVSSETKNISRDISDMIARINKGEGFAGMLLTDTVASNNLKQTLANIKNIGEKTDSMSTELNALIRKVNRGNGAASTFINDTAFASDLKQTMQNIQQGTDAFNENMEALKYSWPFKKYYQNKAAEEKKKKK